MRLLGCLFEEPISIFGTDAFNIDFKICFINQKAKIAIQLHPHDALPWRPITSRSTVKESREKRILVCDVHNGSLSGHQDALVVKLSKNPQGTVRQHHLLR